MITIVIKFMLFTKKCPSLTTVALEDESVDKTNSKTDSSKIITGKLMS